MTITRKMLSLLARAALATCLPILSAQTPPTVTITGYSIPTADGPYRVTTGPDGAIWFTEVYYNKIGRITTTGTISEFPLPADWWAFDITAGQDGALWFTESNDLLQSKVGRITTTGVLTEFPLPPDYPASIIRAGSDGALWFTISTTASIPYYRIGRITTAGVVTTYPLPTPADWILDLTPGPDGALWFTAHFVHPDRDTPDLYEIGRITTAGVITEYVMPVYNYPYAITTGPDGALWFTEFPYAWTAKIPPPQTGNDKIGRMTTAGVITEYTLPYNFNGLNGITAGPDGALWFTNYSAVSSDNCKISRLTPTWVLTEYDTPCSLHELIIPGPDGALWFTEYGHSIWRAVIAPNPARANRAQQTAPIMLGTSGSNIKDTGAFCCGGTLGALVTKTGVATYVLSNNHVLARSNAGAGQDPIIQRGYIDTVPKCSATGTVTVASLYKWVPLDFTGGNNIVDAAIAQTLPGMVDPTGTVIGIGTINPATTGPAVEMPVVKAGRTTGKTTGSINALNVTARVNYRPCGGGATQTAKFVKQFRMVPDVTFARAGDSGSLILKRVATGRPNPVGLLFASASDGSTLANPINSVLSALGVTFVGTASAAELANAAAQSEDPQIAAVSQVKDRYEDYLSGLPEVVGHGVGYARDGSRKPVIQLFLRKATDVARQAAPVSLQGVPIEIHETGEFHAIPACGP